MAKTEVDETCMNASGTCADASTKQTRSVHPTRYEVVNNMGIVSPMKFDTIGEAVKFAEYAFPNQEQDEDRSGAGWDIQIAGADR